LKRAAGVVVLLAIGAVLGRVGARIVCAAVGHGKPERAWLGGVGSGRFGYRCSRCGTPAATPGELFGHDDNWRGHGRRSA
jgi:hypothetical protein